MNKSESAAALDESAEPRVLDCHHNDITDIVRDRAEMRPHFKAIKRRRYLRQYKRRSK